MPDSITLSNAVQTGSVNKTGDYTIYANLVGSRQTAPQKVIVDISPAVKGIASFTLSQGNNYKQGIQEAGGEYIVRLTTTLPEDYTVQVYFQ